MKGGARSKHWKQVWEHGGVAKRQLVMSSLAPPMNQMTAPPFPHLSEEGTTNRGLRLLAKKVTGDRRCRRETVTRPIDCAHSYDKRRSVDEREERGAPRSLSERELEVVRLLTEGLTNAEIAARLHITARTAKAHIASAAKKTGARSRTHLAVLALRRRLVPLDPVEVLDE
jgi:DNA-binding CsgD family transcriptional regulator